MQVLTSLRRLLANIHVVLILPREAPDDKQRRNMNSPTVARSTWSFTVLPTEYPSNIWWYEVYRGAVGQTVHGSTDPDTIAYTPVRSSLSGNESSRTSHCFLTWDLSPWQTFLSSSREPYHGISLSFSIVTYSKETNKTTTTTSNRPHLTVATRYYKPHPHNGGVVSRTLTWRT